jgi:TRAP-type C4-dicarboxylate transport system permease small subunit
MIENTSKIVKLTNYIESVLRFIASLVVVSALLVMFSTLLLEVIFRYVTNSSLGWPSELPTILFPWTIMGGVVLAHQKGLHLSVNLIFQFLSVSKSKALYALLNVITVITFAFLFWVSFDILEIVSSEMYPYTNISAKWAYLSLPAGFVGIILTSVNNLSRLNYYEQ